MAPKLPSSTTTWPTIIVSVTLVSFAMTTHLMHPHSGSALKSDLTLVRRDLDSMSNKFESLRSVVGEMREEMGEIRGKTIKGRASAEETALSMVDK